MLLVRFVIHVMKSWFSSLGILKKKMSVGSSETFLNLYQSPQCHIAKDRCSSVRCILLVTYEQCVAILSHVWARCGDLITISVVVEMQII